MKLGYIESEYVALFSDSVKASFKGMSMLMNDVLS